MSRKEQSDIMQLLSVNNLVPLLVTIISIVIFLVKMQSGNELLEYKIDQLSKKLDGYVVSRETASGKMQIMTDLRNKQISELQQNMSVVKNLLKLP